MTYEKLGGGVVKRTSKRVIGLFIDGTGLDRASRRMNRRIDMASLVRGVTSGTAPAIARYYTLIPYEDDSRQRAFLDAVARAGLAVIVKRLPPKGVTRQVSVESEMASDLVAFALGHSHFSSLSQYQAEEPVAHHNAAIPLRAHIQKPRARPAEPAPGNETTATAAEPAHLDPVDAKVERIVTVVCPGRDLAYPISLVKEFGVDTVSADFGQFNIGDVLKSAAKWIDLSDSETIWME